MATDLTTPSKTLAKMRWLETYVSEGLNKKLNGIIPRGVVRGGRLTTNLVDMTVTIEADPDFGDSIYSYIDSNGHQVTFRQQGDISLALGAVASTTIYAGLEITYAISADTEVKWRAFSQAEIDADDSIVVLGQVVVPASGLIAASAITPEGRREAWAGIAPQMREWRQIVKEGDFGSLGNSGGSVTIDTTSVIPAWKTSNLGTFTWTVETIDPYVGDYHLKVEDAVTGVDYLSSLEVFKCRPGSLLHVFYAVQGINMITVGASGEYGIHFFFYDEDRQYIASDIAVTDNTLTGTFGWTEVGKVIEAPANAAFFKYAIRVNTDGVAFGASTVLYFDAIRIFAQADRATDGHDGGYIQDEATQFVSMDIAPEIGSYSDLEERNDRTVRLESNGFVSSVIELLMGAKNNSDFILRLLGSLGIDGVVERDFLSSSDYQLIWDNVHPTTGPHIRLYVNNYALNIAINASYVGSVWNRDWTFDDSMLFRVASNQITGWKVESTAPDGWSSWTTNGKRLFDFGTGAALIEGDTNFTDDARIQFTDTTDDVVGGSNPPGTDYDRNLLCAKNTVKCFMKENTFIPVVANRFNVSGANLVAGATPPETAYYTIDFDLAFASQNDWVAVAALDGLAPWAGICELAVVDAGNSSASRVALKFFDNNGADLTGSIVTNFNLIVMGKYVG